MSKEYNDAFYKTHGAGIHSDPFRFKAIADLCQGNVLDIGCGTGDLADFWKGAYRGIDISDVAINLAEEIRRKDAVFIVRDVTLSYALHTEKYDTIVLTEFLEHLENDDQVFENIKTWAKPNTRLIISVPNGDRVQDEDHKREFTVPELRKRFSDLGKVKFYNWSGFKDRILMTVDFMQPNDDLCSLVMMVKNEEKGLERAILSTIEFVDNIVISVDNSTNDDTLKVAERYADVLKKHTWENDFSKVRNSSGEGVKTKWILSLDGHEYVEKYPDLEKALSSESEVLMNTVRMDSGDSFINARFYRPHIKWTHAIHNVLQYKKPGKYIEFIIVHDRLGGQGKKAVKERMEQVKEMMEKELKKELKIPLYKPRALFYLARWYRSVWKRKKAIKYYKKYLKNPRHVGEQWLACYEAGVLCASLKKYLSALKFYRKAEELIPNRWETAKITGVTYMAFNQWEKALDFLVDSFKINEGDFSFNPMERDNAETWDRIGFCFFQQKKYKKAKVAWEEAIEKEENEGKKRLNRKRIELIDRELIL